MAFLMQADPAISRLLMLRSGAIAVQFFAVLAVYLLLDRQIHLLPLLGVIGVESLFQVGSIFAYRNVSQAKPIGMLLQLSADVLFLALLLSLSGGATNAFVSLLLLPIMIAAVTVNSKGLAYIAILAIVAYTLLLFKMPHHAMHQTDMASHFVGMWVNFVVSAIVIALVIGTMNRALYHRERAISKAREAQLRNEQLVTLDGAAAQITHQLATPIANLQLLFEELVEDAPDNLTVKEMAQPLKQCAAQLAGFRKLSESLRVQSDIASMSLHELQQQISDSMLLQYPSQTLTWLTEAPHYKVYSDPMLLPAILNLLQNAAMANKKADKNSIELSWDSISEKSSNIPSTVSLLIRDFGTGFSEQQLSQLGGQLMPSDNGMGLAVLLSNVTFERLKGSLTLFNHKEVGALAKVKLVIVEDDNS